MQLPIDYLRNLTPKRAFYLFTAFLLLGSFVVISHYYAVLLSNSFIMVYGLCLLYSQNKAFVVLSLQTKNSPYFLGFMFTLVALSTVFLEKQAAPTWETFSGEIAVALSTTVFGLLVRQCVFSFDPAQAHQADIIRSIAEQLRERAEEYRQAQARLMGLINGFIDSREQLYEQEEAISAQYVSSLGDAVKAIHHIHNDFTQTVQESVSSTGQLLDRFQSSIESMTDQFSGAVSKVQQHYLSALEDGHVTIRNVHEKYQSSLEEAMNSTTHIAASVGQSLIDILKDLRQNQEASANAAQSIPQLLDSCRNKLESTNTALDQTTQMLLSQIGQYDDVLSKRLKRFSEELYSIDEIIDSFIQTLQKNLKRIKP